jgi:hypothetical protein
MPVTATFRTSGTIEAVLQEIPQDIGEAGIAVSSQRRDGDRLLVQTRPTLLSWGEEITFEVGNGVLNVTSYPRAQAFDWGKSRDNLERLARVFVQRGWAKV